MELSINHIGMNPSSVFGLLPVLRDDIPERSEDRQVDNNGPSINWFRDRSLQSITEISKSYVTVNRAIERAHNQKELALLKSNILKMVAEAKDEAFEDGMESTFSKRLIALLENHGETAINQIFLLEESGSIPLEVLAEGLRWLGNMDSDVAYERRRLLLEKCLFHWSVIVRDGAILGVSFLEDQRSVNALEKAQRDEVHDALRADINQAIYDLNSL